MGTQVASFRALDIAGGEVGPAHFHGRSVLLVNWSPTCGFCRGRSAPDLIQMAPALLARQIEIVLLSFGPVDANTAKAAALHLPFKLLLKPESMVDDDPFIGLGTPAAYLLDREGRIASVTRWAPIRSPRGPGGRRHGTRSRSVVMSATSDGAERQEPRFLVEPEST